MLVGQTGRFCQCQHYCMLASNRISCSLYNEHCPSLLTICFTKVNTGKMLLLFLLCPVAHMLEQLTWYLKVITFLGSAIFVRFLATAQAVLINKRYGSISWNVQGHCGFGVFSWQKSCWFFPLLIPDNLLKFGWASWEVLSMSTLLYAGSNRLRSTLSFFS